MTSLGIHLLLLIGVGLNSFGAQLAAGPDEQPAAKVEVEEDIYSYQPANNGAGPLWCSGSTCLVRCGEAVFASGLETLQSAKPLNNCRWLLFERAGNRWRSILQDTNGRTREPCPLAIFHDGTTFLSANPTLAASSEQYSGPARPEIIQFSASLPARGFDRLLPRWDGSPAFTEHSYRSFAADGAAGELILFQNIGYTHAEWAFRDGHGQWSGYGKLKWPWGGEYEKPEPIRICYPNVALRNRAVHFVGVSDIVEPNSVWRAYKKQLTGQEWDYDFRRLFYTWTTNIAAGSFAPWIEIASREATCGWINPGDLWLAPDGSAHLLWTERALDERLRSKFFPKEKQSTALNYAVVRDGKVALRRTLALAQEGGAKEIPGRGRFQVTPENRLWVVYYVSGQDGAGKAISENRLLQLGPDGTAVRTLKLPLQHPFTDFFTATPRAGSKASSTLDLLGQRAGTPATISYARVLLP